MANSAKHIFKTLTVLGQAFRFARQQKSGGRNMDIFNQSITIFT